MRFSFMNQWTSSVSAEARCQRWSLSLLVKCSCQMESTTLERKPSKSLVLYVPLALGVIAGFS
jgi:hypothetical protein